jgi:xanthosine utilization system XapX-like protein
MVYFKNEKNSPFVIIVTFFGMLLRYLILNVIRILMGKKPKNILAYSQGFKQILYNIMIIFGCLFLYLFYKLYEASQGY